MSVKVPSTLGGFVLPIKSVSPSSLYGDDEFQYLDIASVDRDTRSILSPQTIHTAQAPSRARQLVQADDVIVSTVRPNLNTVAHVAAEYDGAIASTGFCVLRANPAVLDHRYLYHWISSQKSVDYLVSVATGASYPAVSDKIIKGMDFDPPPLEEQKRIAAILDKADSLRRKRAQAIALADDFLRATFLDMFGDPVTNPKGWPVKPLGTLIEKIKSGWSAPSTDAEYIEGTLGVLKVSAVSSGYFKRAEAKVVDPSIVDRDLIFPVMGDLLFSRANTRELVAAACLVEEDCESAFLPDKLWQITCSHGVARNEYLKFLLADLKFKDELTKKATGTSGSMLNISQAKFVETNAPIPPYELQSRFADAVWRVYSLRKKWFESDYSIGNLFRGLSSDL